MTRGRKPQTALDEAYGIAGKRGEVFEVAYGRNDHFHFLIFKGNSIVFVKIKRTLAHACDTAMIQKEYPREIRHLALVPPTMVSTREFWVRSPRGRWQFFTVETDGSVVPRPDLSF